MLHPIAPSVTRHRRQVPFCVSSAWPVTACTVTVPLRLALDMERRQVISRVQEVKTFHYQLMDVMRSTCPVLPNHRFVTFPAEASSKSRVVAVYAIALRNTLVLVLSVARFVYSWPFLSFLMHIPCHTRAKSTHDGNYTILLNRLFKWCS